MIKKQKRVLVACEYSGRVREAFRRVGFYAMSCDLEASLLPGEHYQGDVRDVLDSGWDLMVAHPPCTHLASSGARWWPLKQRQQKDAIKFVKLLLAAPIECIALENPIGLLSTVLRKPEQIIQPWQFGDAFTKSTCLWLKNLPLLVPTQIVSKGVFVIHGGRKLPKWYSNREFDRSLTFQGIADAMAIQWGACL